MRITYMTNTSVENNLEFSAVFPLDSQERKINNKHETLLKARVTKVALDSLARDAQNVKQLNKLIEAVGARRDKVAFDLLFQYFVPRLKAFFLKQGAEIQSVEEVVQDTMVNVWRKAYQFDSGKASASTWIFTIARNRRIDLLRKSNRPEPDPTDPAFVPGPEKSSFDIIDKEQEAKQLGSVIKNLPADQQKVLQLAFFKEKAHAEVADELGIPLGTVKSRIRLALKKIRKELERGNETQSSSE